MKSFYQGECIKIGTQLLDESGSPRDLTGASGILGYTDDALITKTINCIVDGNKIYAKFTPAITAEMLGYYVIEIKVKDSIGDISTELHDEFSVLKSYIPIFPS